MGAVDPSIIRPLIDVSRAKGRFDWVVYICPHDAVPRNPKQSREERRAEWLAVDAFLTARFGVNSVPGDDLEGNARNTLALLIAEGSATSQEDALAQAIATSAFVAPDLGAAVPHWKEAYGRPTTRLHAREVETVRKARTTLKKLAQMEQAAETATAEEGTASRYIYARYAYTDSDWGTEHVSFQRFRVVRESSKFLFVHPYADRRSYGEDWVLHWRDTERLGRGTVRLEKAWIGDGGGDMPYSVFGRLHLYRRTRLEWSEADLEPLMTDRGPQCTEKGDPDIRLLGLEPGGLTAGALKKAYRIKAKAFHPDTGGDAQQFQALNDAYARLQQRLTLQEACS